MVHMHVAPRLSFSASEPRPSVCTHYPCCFAADRLHCVRNPRMSPFHLAPLPGVTWRSRDSKPRRPSYQRHSETSQHISQAMIQAFSLCCMLGASTLARPSPHRLIEDRYAFCSTAAQCRPTHPDTRPRASFARTHIAERLRTPSSLQAHECAHSNRSCARCRSSSVA